MIHHKIPNEAFLALVRRNDSYRNASKVMREELEQTDHDGCFLSVDQRLAVVGIILLHRRRDIDEFYRTQEYCGIALNIIRNREGTATSRCCSS